MLHIVHIVQRYVHKSMCSKTGGVYGLIFSKHLIDMRGNDKKQETYNVFGKVISNKTSINLTISRCLYKSYLWKQSTTILDIFSYSMYEWSCYNWIKCIIRDTRSENEIYFAFWTSHYCAHTFNLAFKHLLCPQNKQISYVSCITTRENIL